MDRVTFATSTGAVWISLALHFGAGLLAILSGTIALSVTKGGGLHKQSGLAFTWSMIVLGLSAAGIGAYENNPGQVVAGLLAAYLVYTAMATVKQLPRIAQRFDVGLMLLAFALAALNLYAGANEWLDASVVVVGRPRVVPPLVGGSVMLLAAVGDLRAIRAGGLQGKPRLVRHLWRMCFGLFIATGSFFLGQMKFVPEAVRIVPVLVVLAFAPIPLLFYWMWRVRARGLN